MSLKNIIYLNTALHMKSCSFLALMLAMGPVLAQPLLPEADAVRERPEAQGWLVHGQATFVEQLRPAFSAPYIGPNSMQRATMQRNTLSADIILGRRLWQGAEFIFDTQLSRGFGLSGTRGVAGFPNGEAFRIGSNDPRLTVTRAFIRQTIGLGGGEDPGDAGDQFRFNRPLPRERITITAGKFAVFDIFDDNRYAHDPRTQFLNWAFIAAGAVDWSNDAKGYTNGVAVEWDNGIWGLRGGAVQVARRVNSLSLDPQPGRGYQLLAQLDHFHSIGGRPGALRLIGGFSRTRSQSWAELMGQDDAGSRENPRGSYRHKYMLALNMEQEIAPELGVFARLSWNDGRNQQWMYTQMDWAISAGLSLGGGRWGRAADTVGLAANIGGLGGPQRRFLEAGGAGFIIGDGRLNYRPERVVELYYDARVAAGTNVAANIQLVNNPGHNADRGPIVFLGLRVRTAF